jgi:type VI secretion system secreted protein Hcp
MADFLAVNGIGGGSTEASHRGWFDVEGYSYDVSLPVDPVGGGGGAGGRPQFSPLAVNLELGTGLTDLLAAVTTGRVIPSARLESTTDQGDAVYDLTLGNVLVSGLHDEAGSADRLRLDYSAFDLTTRAQTPTGQLGPAESFSFDLATAQAGVSVPAPVVGTSGGGVPTPSRFFLLVEGIGGDSTEAAHQGWFDIEGYSYDVSLPVGPVGGGGGTGDRPQFSPLAVNLDLDTGLAGLLAAAATGRVIPSVRLDGVTDQGDVVYSLTLSGVLVAGLHDEAGPGDRLSFSYERFELTTRALSETGELGVPQSFMFDLRTAQAAFAEFLPAASTDASDQAPGGQAASAADYLFA